ncbi:hypothetical protein [Cupriavidus numazuensis]|uniref:hypothetical protein n=1 Tax=Cupriavidus numazuensis TaxID=221992 RepID=UPI001BAD2799|nr:hypothetical protein [Cupriavidus numazuensis]
MTAAVELMASGNDALFGYFLSLGQKVTRRLRRRNSSACQERHPNPNHKTPADYAGETAAHAKNDTPAKAAKSFEPCIRAHPPLSQ